MHGDCVGNHNGLASTPLPLNTRRCLRRLSAPPLFPIRERWSRLNFTWVSRTQEPARTHTGSCCRPVPRILRWPQAPRALCTGGLDPRDLKTALFCISFLRKGEVLAYVGRIHNLKDLQVCVGMLVFAFGIQGYLGYQNTCARSVAVFLNQEHRAQNRLVSVFLN